MAFLNLHHYPGGGRGRKPGRWKISRAVTLPDYQGAGIGLAVYSAVAALHRERRRADAYGSMTHPGLVRALNRSPHWALVNQELVTPHKGVLAYRTGMRRARRVYVSTFRYVGPRASELSAA